MKEGREAGTGVEGRERERKREEEREGGREREKTQNCRILLPFRAM